MPSISQRIKSPLILLLLSFVLNALSLMYLNFPAALASLILFFFVSIGEDRSRSSFSKGFIFGAGSSLILNSWMITVVTHYVKGSMMLGLLCYLASAIVLGIFFGLFSWTFNKLRRREAISISHVITNAALAASLWVVLELLRQYLFSALPWLSFSTGITEARSLYMIQASEFGGAPLLSFIIVVAAYLCEHSIRTRAWKMLVIPGSLLLIQFIAGVLIHSNAVERVDKALLSTTRTAVVLPGLSPEVTWNDASANTLVSGLLMLNVQAMKEKPQLVVWSETVVPWTYRADDDFVKILTMAAGEAGAYTLIGMNTASDSGQAVLYNSAYLLSPDGKSTERYDKQDLLTFVEKPMMSDNGFILPFLASSGKKMQSGRNHLPMQSPFGKIGVMICNESTSPDAASAKVRDGAGFLVNMGNDSWFSDYYIPSQHFYNCRLRAVETRKDVIVSNNRGMAGLIRADGTVAAERNAGHSGLLMLDVRANSLSSRSHSGFQIVIGLILLFTLLDHVRTNYKQPTKNK